MGNLLSNPEKKLMWAFNYFKKFWFRLDRNSEVNGNPYMRLSKHLTGGQIN